MLWFYNYFSVLWFHVSASWIFSLSFCFPPSALMPFISSKPLCNCRVQFYPSLLSPSPLLTFFSSSFHFDSICSLNFHHFLGLSHLASFSWYAPFSIQLTASSVANYAKENTFPSHNWNTSNHNVFHCKTDNRHSARGSRRMYWSVWLSLTKQPHLISLTNHRNIWHAGFSYQSKTLVTDKNQRCIQLWPYLSCSLSIL